MDKDSAHHLFKLLFNPVNGFDISMKSRRKHEMTDKELTYGEVEFEPFWEILDAAKLAPNDVFYDLGCGTGKPVFIAAFKAHCKEAIGVEILPEVYEKAEDLRKLCLKFAPDLPTRISFIHDDVENVDISNASVIFLPSTCYDAEMMTRFSERCKDLKPGTRIITLTKQLSGDHLTLIHRKMYVMSWGDTTVHIFQRV